MKKYILIAGVNGAGKSTLYHILDELQEMPRINTDDIVKSFGRWDNPSDVMKAGKIAIKMIEEYFQEGCTFNQETTLCGKSILKNIEKAKKLGYSIEVHYVCVDSIEIAKERIRNRVSNGGHGIPDRDVERRYGESIQNITSVLKQCERVTFYDNTDYFKRIAFYYDGEFEVMSEEVPKWLKAIVKNNE